MTNIIDSNYRASTRASHARHLNDLAFIALLQTELRERKRDRSNILLRSLYFIFGARTDKADISGYEICRLLALSGSKIPEKFKKEILYYVPLSKLEKLIRRVSKTHSNRISKIKKTSSFSTPQNT